MRAWGLPGESGGLVSGPVLPGSSATGPWPRAERRLPAAPRGTGWGPAAGQGRRSGGSGSLPLARAQESAEGRAEAPGWAAPLQAGGRGALPGAARPGSCAVCPQALPERAEPPELRAAGASRAQVSGCPWGEKSEPEPRPSRRQRRADRPSLLCPRRCGTGRGRGGPGRVGPEPRPA